MKTNEFKDIESVKSAWKFLGDLSWPREMLREDVIKTKYNGHFGAIEIILWANEEGVSIAVTPLIDKPINGWGGAVLNMVEGLNFRSKTFSIGVGVDGNLYTKVDIPKNIEFEKFAYSIINLCQISEQLTLPLLQADACDHYGKVYG